MFKSFLLSLLFGCTAFIPHEDVQKTLHLKADGKNSELNIIFTHNIDGETHPCGCRNFPLGGLPQVAGKIYALKQEGPVIFINTGDTLFSSTQFPKHVQKSEGFKAQEIASTLKQINIDFMLLGEKDFALGQDYLIETIKKYQLPILISNLTAKSPIPHKRWGHVSFDNRHLFFVGIVSTDMMARDGYLMDAETSLKQVLSDIKNAYPKIKNKEFILLSHMGLEEDQIIAKKFPEFSWIIGAHSQSFLRRPIEIGTTKIVQTLSRNHYLGHIVFSPDHKTPERYSLIEVRDELKDLIPNSPFITRQDAFLNEFNQIQAQEQKSMILATNNSGVKKSTTYVQCQTCHTQQTKFWSETSHALAMGTLHKHKAANNGDCIRCHSLDWRRTKGPQSVDELVTLPTDDKNQKDLALKEYADIFTDFSSLRKMPLKERKKFYSQQVAWENKHKVVQHYGNVQCLNCHDQVEDHPFASAQKQKTNYALKCINCHTPDQSPEWYNKKANGIANTLNTEYFSTQLKKVSCPRINNDS